MTAEQVSKLSVTFEDDPRVMKEAATEDYSLHVVPTTWRSSKNSLLMAWMSLFSAMFWLVFPALLALQVGTINTLIGIGLSIVAYSLVNGVLARYSARTGLTVSLFSRSMFGYLGAALASLTLAATAIYYAVFEGSVISVALSTYFGGISLNLWYLVVVLYSIPLAFGGVQRWLDKFNGFLLPFYVIGLIGAVIWAIVDFGYSNAWLLYKPAVDTVSGPGWWFVFAQFMGVWIMMMYTWDFARFSRKTDEKFHRNVTFGPVFYFLTLGVNGAIGIFLAQTIRTEGGVSELTVVLGIVAMMGFFGVALVWVSQTRINTTNFYMSSSNLESFFSRVFKLRMPRTVWVAIAGAIIYLIMLTNVFSFILQALRYQAVVVVAWVGVTLVHVLSSKVKALSPVTEFRPGRVPLVNPGGLGSWVTASVTGCLIAVFGGAFGATWAAPIAFVAAVVLYLASLGVAKRGWFAIQRPYDPHDEVEDPWAARAACWHCTKSYVVVEMDRDPSHDHDPICAACAAESLQLYSAARAEATASSAR